MWEGNVGVQVMKHADGDDDDDGGGVGGDIVRVREGEWGCFMCDAIRWEKKKKEGKGREGKGGGYRGDAMR